MKWYQVIECDKTVKNPMVCDIDNFESFEFDEDTFRKGTYIENWPEGVFVQPSTQKLDGETDDALQTEQMIPIYSPRLVRALEEGGVEGIQYLPITVRDYMGNYVETFQIGNYLHFVSALDMEASKYSRFGEESHEMKHGKISGVRRYVLKREQLNEYDTIRLADFEWRFFVSEKFVKIFQKNNFTGYSFIEVGLT